MIKQRGQPGNLIDKKPPKLDKKTKKKPIICCFVGDKIPPKPSEENGEENQIFD